MRFLNSSCFFRLNEAAETVMFTNRSNYLSAMRETQRQKIEKSKNHFDRREQSDEALFKPHRRDKD
jgi:hypothetical protein